ncbi:MAG: RNA methyltransferase [Verrucomicrobiota bacterium]
MARLKQTYQSQGFYGMGIYYSSGEFNIGTLWRSAFILGASYIYTIGRAYKRQTSDVTNSWSRIPLYHYSDFDHFRESIPFSTQLIGVELCENATPLEQFEHPKRASYLLGSESTGLPQEILQHCQSVISLPGNFSLNVAVAGSIIAHDRVIKNGATLPERGQPIDS